MSDVDDPCELLERRRSRELTSHFRAFACACCRRIWEHLTPELRYGVEVAEQYLVGTADDHMRKCAGDKVRRECIYVDGDSSAADRYSGFAAEAALSCLFGDDDYPPIPTYGTTCAIATSRAVVEVVYAFTEMRGCCERSCEETAKRERNWQCQLISELFENRE